MLEEFFDQYAAGYRYAKPGGDWCYEDGCVYRGLLELYRATGEERWRDHLVRLAGEQVAADGSLRGYRVDEFNIDNIMAGRVLFFLAAMGEARYAMAADLLISQLESHPRTRAGNYWHKLIYPQQVWLDGLYMALPFQIEYGLSRGRPELVDDAIAQLERALALMGDPATGLYFHGYDDARTQPWADPQTGLSQSFWGRAVGWLSMALVDSADLLPASHGRHGDLAAATRALGKSIMRFRTGSGLWLQVMDRPDLDGNYVEASASAMFAYFLLKTARRLPESEGFRPPGEKALEALGRDYVRRGDDGVWRLDGVCEVAGLGQYRGRLRDGTPAYYASEKITPNDPKGVGPLMMAVAEAKRRKMAGSRRAASDAA